MLNPTPNVRNSVLLHMPRPITAALSAVSRNRPPNSASATVECGSAPPGLRPQRYAPEDLRLPQPWDAAKDAGVQCAVGIEGRSQPIGVTVGSIVDRPAIPLARTGRRQAPDNGPA